MDLYNFYSTYINTAIDSEMYMNFAISSCFDEIVRSFKTLEFGVYKKNRKNGYDLSNSLNSKRINRTIKRPNPLSNFSSLIESYLTAKYFNGNCLFRKIKGVMNDDLYIYSNNFYEVSRDENNLLLKTIRIGTRNFSGEELKNFKLVSEFNYKSQLQGIDSGKGLLEVLEPIKKIINGSIAHNISIMKNGGSLNGFLTFGGKENEITSKEKERIRKEFDERYAGVGNSGKMGILFGDTKYQATGTTPKDLEFIESLKEMQKIICRKMGVPEVLIIGDNSSYNNTVEFKKKMYTELIIPLAKEFCEHLTYLFYEDLETEEEIYFSTSNIKVLQSSLATEIKELAEALTGKTTVNNLIDIINDKYQLGLKPLGEQGDIVLVQSSMMSLKDIPIDITEPEENVVEDGSV